MFDVIHISHANGPHIGMGEFQISFLIIISYSHGNIPAHDTPELRNFTGYNIQEVSKA